MAKFLPLPNLDYFFDKIISIKQAEYNEQTIKLIAEFSENALNQLM